MIYILEKIKFVYILSFSVHLVHISNFLILIYEDLIDKFILKTARMVNSQYKTNHAHL
jgi:hypothetical protein